jgi:hypothetical protein
MNVLDGDNPEIKEWSVTSKQIRDQLKAIARRYGFPNGDIVGAVFKVAANGEGLQRKYWVELVQKPGQPVAQARPAPIPVSDADRERDFQARQAKAQGGPQSQDSGQAWIADQKKGLEQVPTSVQAQGAH